MQCIEQAEPVSEDLRQHVIHRIDLSADIAGLVLRTVITADKLAVLSVRHTQPASSSYIKQDLRASTLSSFDSLIAKAVSEIQREKSQPNAAPARHKNLDYL